MNHLPKAQVQRLARAKAHRKVAMRETLANFDSWFKALRSNIHLFRDKIEAEPLVVYERLDNQGRTQYGIPSADGSIEFWTKEA
jgi:hypothetical protein